MFDTKNDFLHAENDEYVLMLIYGNLAELSVEVYTKLYQKYVITSKQGMPMLYAKLIKAIYGMLRSAVLFYNNLRSYLGGIGFKINPYDPCVTSMMINSYRMTFFDYLRVSHKEESD